mmetsp:Transcript_16409/g.31478  ORF Transcript_16409/g.31478 Transcript_16409/m.31478 type:complete len:254 (-) Transcript_16409:1121-1882(-)
MAKLWDFRLRKGRCNARSAPWCGSSDSGGSAGTATSRASSPHGALTWTSGWRRGLRAGWDCAVACAGSRRCLLGSPPLAAQPPPSRAARRLAVAADTARDDSAPPPPPPHPMPRALPPGPRKDDAPLNARRAGGPGCAGSFSSTRSCARRCAVWAVSWRKKASCSRAGLRSGSAPAPPPGWASCAICRRIVTRSASSCASAAPRLDRHRRRTIHPLTWARMDAHAAAKPAGEGGGFERMPWENSQHMRWYTTP